MKTRNVNPICLIKNSILILVLLIGFFQQGISQEESTKTSLEAKNKSTVIPMNSLRFNPIKAMGFGRLNLSYERKSKNYNYFVITEIEAWLQGPSKSWGERASNKGIRYSVGVKNYYTTASNNSAFYVGSSIFYGRHKIGDKQALNNTSSSENYKDIDHRIQLTSLGLKVHLGIRKNFKKNLFVEAGLDASTAWNSTETNTVWVYNHSANKSEAKLRSALTGQSIEPVLIFGFVF